MREQFQSRSPSGPSTTSQPQRFLTEPTIGSTATAAARLARPSKIAAAGCTTSGLTSARPAFGASTTRMKKSKDASALALSVNSIPSSPQQCAPPTNPSPKLHTFWGGLDGLPTQGFSGNIRCQRWQPLFQQSVAGRDAHRASSSGFNKTASPSPLSEVKAADILDSLSSTLAFTEIKMVEDTDSHDLRGRYHNSTHGGVLFTTLYPPNTTRPDSFNWSRSAAGRCSPACGDLATCRSPPAATTAAAWLTPPASTARVAAIPTDIEVAVYNQLGSRGGGVGVD